MTTKCDRDPCSYRSESQKAGEICQNCHEGHVRAEPAKSRTRRDTTDYVKLAQDLEAAAFAATRCSRDDGGTCNFDSAVLFMDKMDQEKVERAANQAGLGVGFRNWAGDSCCFLHAPMGGQGSRRTVQAEAMEKLLRERGWKVTCYYQID